MVFKKGNHPKSEFKKGNIPKNKDWLPEQQSGYKHGNCCIAFYRKMSEYDKIDNCSLCNKKVDFLVVHHKDKNRANNSKDNLIVICRGCHAKLHEIGKWNKGKLKTEEYKKQQSQRITLWWKKRRMN